MLRIAWGITGCGDQIEETFAIMKDLLERYDLDIKVYLSKNGELVMKWYDLWKELKDLFPKVSVEHGANSPFIAGQLQMGKFDLFLVCPMSANTAAKIAHGIADSLLTNGVAQAAKAKIPIYIYPADQYEGAVTTILPDGKELTLYMRDVDIENADRLKRMQEITVLEDIREIEGVVQGHIDDIGV
ncbi:MAG: archaeoflavoprotein AfpA [Candidatus Methanogaster sp.]|uniref:Archaeoflavoprotein AfpA n=1 Tax=Candidatus Methanogaster sp. TaxID=3386292 RepID=A0AC61KYP7_9EURY|nr:MAG: archaeoflavoprotein AfpA [ANME-2 cluster archaeon]